MDGSLESDDDGGALHQMELVEWAAEDADIARTRTVRELNRAIHDNNSAREDLVNSVAKRESIRKALAANTELVEQLNATIVKEELGVMKRKKRLAELEEHKRLLDYKGNILTYEAKVIHRMPSWWFMVVLLHEILSFYAYGKRSWIFWVVNQWMFLAHLRRFYVKPSAVNAFISCIIVPLSVFFI
jgi:hypothetical protein